MSASGRGCLLQTWNIRAKAEKKKLWPNDNLCGSEHTAILFLPPPIVSFARQHAIISLTDQVGNNVFGRKRTPAPGCERRRARARVFVRLTTHHRLSPSTQGHAVVSNVNYLKLWPWLRRRSRAATC